MAEGPEGEVRTARYWLRLSVLLMLVGAVSTAIAWGYLNAQHEAAREELASYSTSEQGPPDGLEEIVRRYSEQLRTVPWIGGGATAFLAVFALYCFMTLTSAIRAQHAWDFARDVAEHEARSQSFHDEFHATQTQKKAATSDKIFVVHGHDEAAKHAVANHLWQAGLQPVVLHEQANEGRTILEKFEDHADVGFAVILCTPDDLGRANGDTERPRARQNVILELGYFVGRLGRNRVCYLVSEGIELPSDILGVGAVAFDAGGLWRRELDTELRAAGYTLR